MKAFFTLLCLLTLISCKERIKQKQDNVTTKDSIRPVPDFAIGLRFINDYTEFCNREFSSHPDTSESQWLSQNKMVTDHFRTEYKNLLDSAKKVDPELGLDADPIFDAQDYPDKGFDIMSKDSANGYMTVIGRNQDTMKVVLKLTNQNSKWLVDGCGIINIPEDRRALR